MADKRKNCEFTLCDHVSLLFSLLLASARKCGAQEVVAVRLILHCCQNIFQFPLSRAIKFCFPLKQSLQGTR